MKTSRTTRFSPTTIVIFAVLAPIAFALLIAYVFRMSPRQNWLVIQRARKCNELVFWCISTLGNKLPGLVGKDH